MKQIPKVQGHRPSDPSPDTDPVDVESQIKAILDFKVDESKRVTEGPVDIHDGLPEGTGFTIRKHVNPLLMTFDFGPKGEKPNMANRS